MHIIIEAIFKRYPIVHVSSIFPSTSASWSYTFTLNASLKLKILLRVCLLRQLLFLPSASFSPVLQSFMLLLVFVSYHYRSIPTRTATLSFPYLLSQPSYPTNEVPSTTLSCMCNSCAVQSRKKSNQQTTSPTTKCLRNEALPWVIA